MSKQQPPPRVPLYAAAVAFSAGILFAHYAWRPQLWIASGFAWTCICSALVLARRPRLAHTLALFALALAGSLALWGEFALEKYQLLASDLSRFTTGDTITLTAHVIRDAVALPSSNGAVDHQQIDIETEELTDDSGSTEIRAGIRLSIYCRELYGEDTDDSTCREPFRYGERLRLTAKLHPLHNFRTPGSFDAAGYFKRQGIVARGSAKVENVERLSGFAGSRWSWYRSRARQSVMSVIARTWPQREAVLLDAMLIGERSYIDRDTNIDFQKSGTYHILVVSGMNVSILAFVVFWFLRRLRLGETVASFATIVLSGAYAFLCDGGAPIVRATLMLSVYLCARLLYRERSGLNAVGAAALCVLVWDPRSLFDASFQLTFLSVMAIASIGVPLLERTSDPVRKSLRNFDSTTFDIVLTPRQAQFRVELRMLIRSLSRILGNFPSRLLLLGSSRAALAIFDVLAISALMQITLALPMAAYFHRATIMALPANSLVVPLTEVMMPASVASVALGYLSPALSKIPAVIAGWSVDAITGTIRVLGAFRVADLRVADVPSIVPVVVTLAIAFAMFTARRHRLLALAGLTALIATAAWVTIVPRHSVLSAHALEITSLDVGQGDAILVVSPDGHTLLIDAGGPSGFSRSTFDYGENIVSTYLWSRGIDHLDAVMITHAHSDHIGGMATVIANFHPHELWLGPHPDTPAIEKLLAAAASFHVHIISHAKGDEFSWAGTDVRVLSPPADWVPNERTRNNDSLVIRIQYGETSALLSGDAEKQMEPALAEQHLHADLLKIAHHGSHNSTTPELLDSVRPQYAIISDGLGNPFRHPRPEVLERLSAAHVLTYRTDMLGAVTFYLDGKRVITPGALPN